ncbi:MAG: GNAT family N-acetyltransferase [bacterium]
MSIKIKIAVTPGEMQQTQAIRHKVFVLEQGIPSELNLDGRDGDAVHVLAYLDNVPVATGRINILPGGEGELARIAVLPEARGKSLGKLVVQQLEKYAKSAGATSVFLHPHDYLETFYANLGYEKTNETMIVANYRLIKMRKKL